MSIADKAVQEKRKKVVIPGKKTKLHDYANLYFNPRNPMMYVRRAKHAELCVISVNKSVLNKNTTVVTDGNASSDYTCFFPSPTGLKFLKEDEIFIDSWNDSNSITKMRKKTKICAEVLVLNKVPPQLFNGVYVSNNETKNIVIDMLKGSIIEGKVRVKKEIFFK